MTPKEFIETTRRFADIELPSNLIDEFAFKPVVVGGERKDENLSFRTQIVEGLLNDFSQKDINLIRQLFNEEIKCEVELWGHDNIYQLCYYLYDLGNLQDTFIIYDGKYNIRHMDIAFAIDREMITVGHDANEVIEYVQKQFSLDPNLQEKYSDILLQLHGIKNKPDYESKETYKKFIKGYFFGHDEKENEVETQIQQNDLNTEKTISKKPWWKFW